jgi:hypothetical protein
MAHLRKTSTVCFKMMMAKKEPRLINLVNIACSICEIELKEYDGVGHTKSFSAFMQLEVLGH